MVWIILLWITCLLPHVSISALDAYGVHFEGDLPTDTIELLHTGSQLIQLQDSPPATSAGLRHRAEADIPDLIQVLHSKGYYNAKVWCTYDFAQTPPLVIVNVEPGSVYPFLSFKILPVEGSSCYASLLEEICLDELGICLGNPAFPCDILTAEESILAWLDKEGYPLATIAKRDVVADQTRQGIHVTIYVDCGSAATFGLTTITGLERVCEAFVQKKIAWVDGCPYDPSKVERTQNALEASGLFTTISITHADHVKCNRSLPMFIEVEEGKHRSVGAGINYNTDWGPGIDAEWENRNLCGMGERLTFKANVWAQDQTVRLSYVEPDYVRRGQDLVWIALLEHEVTRGFHELAFSLSRIIERQWTDRSRFSYGITYMNLRDTHADHNGQYNLLKFPFQFRWSNANHLLDPSRGSIVNFKIVPSWEFLRDQFVYCTTTLTSTYYVPLTKDERWIFAFKVMLGSIWGPHRRTIPASERFYEGSDSSLRGYRYLTVSPLNEHHKPVGGRSLMIYTAELRVKATECFGWVLFYDIGNVYRQIIPRFDRKVLQDVGVGLRYNTPVGPLRLDFAVPLQRRRHRHLDHRFQLYLSIGQAF